MTPKTKTGSNNRAVKGGVLLLALCFFISTPAFGRDKLLVATAVNFISPMSEIARLFQEESGIEIDVTYGSSGKLYSQLQHGAPYDLFLSADHKRPQHLYESGLCEKPFHYGSGEIVLWSTDQSLQAPSWQEALKTSHGKIALASPKAAPYGEKAFEVIRQENLVEQYQSRFIYGQSVGQTFLFTRTGAAHLGFIALAQALSKEGKTGHYWPIPGADPVAQWGCMPIQATEHVRRLTAFLLSDKGRAIIKKHGYQQH